jgi:hypothetical protein
MKEQTQYTIRVQGNRAWTFGLGEIVSPGVAFFKAGHYNLSKEELEVALKRVGKVVLR